MKKKVLAIFFRPPYPPVGGDKIRMYQNLRFLSELYTVDALYINDGSSNEAVHSHIEQWCNRAIRFDLPRSGFFFNTLRGLFFNVKPLQVNYFYHRSIQHWVDKNIDTYEAVFVNTLRTAEYVKNKRVFKIIDFIDAISMNYEKAAQHQKIGIWKLLYTIDKVRLRHYERELLEKFDRHLIISEIDREYILKDARNTDLKIVPNAVYLNRATELNTEVDGISFLGKMDYEPNITAVNYFVKEIFPEVRKSIGNAQFTIVGINPTKQVQKLGKIAGVHVLGFVENFEEHIRGSKLIVAPMISGAGIQNKILQAMALEKCVITTEIGAEGLPEITNEQLIITTSKDEMINQIIELYDDKSTREHIGRSAKNYIARYFDEKRIKEMFKLSVHPDE